MQQFHLEELFDLGVVERDGMILGLVVLPVDRRTVDERAVDVDLAVRAVVSTDTYFGVAGLLAARDGRQTRGRTLGRRLEPAWRIVVRTASSAKKKPPTTSSDGHESMA